LAAVPETALGVGTCAAPVLLGHVAQLCAVEKKVLAQMAEAGWVAGHEG
jgi:hypothetical protein